MKLLVVDDHAIVRAGFARLFAEIPGCIIKFFWQWRGSFGRPSGLDARHHHPRSEHAGLSGFELLRRIRAQTESAKILVATMYAELNYVDRAFDCGAAGYITKSAPPDEFIAAIKTVHKGARYIEPSVCRDMALRSLEHHDPNAAISVRDTEILRLLADGQSLNEIAQNLGVSYKTVANNCSRIKSRLGLQRTKDLLRYAMENHAADRVL